MYIYDRSALKQAAKRDLAPVYWKSVVVSLIATLISIAVSRTTINMAGELYVSIPILSLFVSGQLVYGLCYVFTDILRKKTCNILDVFSGFKRYGSTLLLFVLVQIFTFLWSLLFFIPGIIKSISYSMAFYIQRDNKEMSASECLKASIRLTRGHLGKIFMLGLSFIGWILLSVLTLGIGFFFLFPYMQMSSARMYDFLILNYNEERSGVAQESIATEEISATQFENESGDTL